MEESETRMGLRLCCVCVACVCESYLTFLPFSFLAGVGWEMGMMREDGGNAAPFRGRFFLQLVVLDSYFLFPARLAMPFAHEWWVVPYEPFVLAVCQAASQ